MGDLSQFPISLQIFTICLYAYWIAVGISVLVAIFRRDI